MSEVANASLVLTYIASRSPKQTQRQHKSDALVRPDLAQQSDSQKGTPPHQSADRTGDAEQRVSVGDVAAHAPLRARIGLECSREFGMEAGKIELLSMIEVSTEHLDCCTMI